MRIGSLFSGIGGLELGLEQAGLGPVLWQVEKDPFCREVLAKHWPEVRRYDDVCTIGADELEPVDLVCGGFPCQDVSSAGKGAGLAGERSGLWREYARIVSELRPRWVVVENVTSGATRWLDAVVCDLAERGYASLPLPLSAADVGAPHLRRRIFVVATDAKRDGVRDERERLPRRRSDRVRAQRKAVAQYDGQDRHAANPDRKSEHAGAKHAEVASASTNTDAAGLELEGHWLRSREGSQPVNPGRTWAEGPSVSPVCGVDDGIPDRVDRLRALGNSVVPACSEVVGWVIRELEGI